MKRASLALLGVISAAVITLIGVLVLMRQTLAPVAATLPDAKRPASATSAPNSDTAATIDGIPISYQDWQTATRLDATMSRLTGQPIPSAEETLDRLVNETLLLRGAGLEDDTVTSDQVTSRIASLQTAWGLTADEIATALQSAGLDHRALEERVARLILVERAIQELSAQHPDLEAWLAETRVSARVSLYQSLEAAPTATANSNARPSTAVTALPNPQPTNLPITPQPQAPAPDFVLTSLDGQTVHLADLRGRPVLVNFWTTWCTACRQELPTLQAAYERYGEQVSFLAVDVKEPRDTVASYVSQFELTFPILLDEQGQVSDRLYQVRGIPTSLFIGPDGVVTARHVGPLTEADIDRYLTPISQSTNPQSSTPAPDFTLPGATGTLITLSDYTSQSDVVRVGESWFQAVPRPVKPVRRSESGGPSCLARAG